MNMLGRGSEWLRWEPHIHAPGTIFNDQFGANSWDDYISALESTTPKLSAIGITDYYGISTYERVRAEKRSGRLPHCQLIFPNIEMRLAIGTVKGNYVNVHLLVGASAQFAPRYLSPDPDVYLSRLRGLAEGWTSSGESWIGSKPESDIALTPHRVKDSRLRCSISP
jgi:hypothetical protein